MSRSAHVALVVLALVSVGWLDRWAAPREAARLYADGKFDEAAGALNQALVDAPDSALLHFNLGDAEYRRKQYEPAARAFAQVPQDPEGSVWSAAAAYNLGNALYRQGQGSAEGKPEQALAAWGEALVAYRRAIAGDPSDEDAKFNYEWVSRKIDELKKKLEQQKQEQKQQQQEQQQSQDHKQDEKQQEQQQAESQDQKQDEQQQQDRRQQGEEQQQPRPDQEQQAQRGEEEQQQGEQREDRQGEGAQREPQQQAGDEQPQAGGEPQVADGRMTRDEASALLDGERSEELQPGEMIHRQLGGGDVPAQDW